MNPFAHQETTVNATWDKPGFAFFWEPRVGKSLPQVMTALKLYENSSINGVVVLAPQGVHHNWARDVFPQVIEHEHPAVNYYDVLDWLSGVVGSRKFQQRMDEVLNAQGLAVVCADSNGLTSQRLRDYLEKFVKERKCLLVLDESHYFKTPSAQRTKFILRLAKRCPSRRILSGTPLTSPFDLWSQFNVLDPQILGERFVPFKTKYGIFETKFFGPRAVKVVSGYKNLEELKQLVEPHSSWLTLEDVFPDLPEVLPVERAYFELSPAHQRAYSELKREYILQLEKGEVIVQNPLTMLLRLQQVSRGFVTTDQGITPISSGSVNAAIVRLQHVIDERPTEKIVVWCRFTEDVNQVLGILQSGYLREKTECVRLDGLVDQEQRLENIRRFQTDPNVRVIVGTPSTGGVGVDLSAGSTVVFYSHGFNLVERLQAMSRVRGVNQKNKVSQVDLVAIGTVDERCLSLLEARVDVISKIQDRSALLGVLKYNSAEDEVHAHISENACSMAEQVIDALPEEVIDELLKDAQ